MWKLISLLGCTYTVLTPLSLDVALLILITITARRSTEKVSYGRAKYTEKCY